MSVPTFRRLRRTEASTYLKEKWGIDRKPTTLAKLACVGGGPRFVLFNKVPLYPEPELDAWAQSRFGELKSSTSSLPQRSEGVVSISQPARKSPEKQSG